MFQQTNRTDNFTLLDNPDLATLGHLTSTKVAGIANHMLSLDRLFAACDASKFAVSVYLDLINGFVKHVCAAVDGAQTGKGLRKFAETVERVDVGRLAIPSHR